MTLHKNRSIVQDFVKEAKIHCNTEKLSAEETVMFLNLLSLSGKNLSKIKSLLQSREIDIFPSKNLVDACRKDLLKDYEWDTGHMLMFKDTKVKESISVPYARTRDLKKMVEKSIEKYKPEEFYYLGEPPRLCLIVSSDKGGNVGHHANSCKFGYTIAIKDNPQNVQNYHVYGMYIGSDNMENTKRFHSDFTKDLEILKNSTALGVLHVLVTGDMSFISNQTGHQGASASFPSPFTTVSLDHCRNYHKNEEPHNRENKNCFHENTFRKVIDNISEYMESLANNPKLLRKGGKDASSIIGELLHPIPDDKRIIDGVIPPGLHLVQGLFMKILKKLIKELIEQDDKNSDPELQIKIMEEIKKLEEEIERRYQEIQKLGDEWLDCQNFIIAYQADEAEFVTKKKEKCASEKCILMKSISTYK